MLEYLKGFFDKTDPTKSLKHAAYALGVCSATAWLSYDIFRTPMTANWVVAFSAFLTTVVVGKVVEPKQPSEK